MENIYYQRALDAKKILSDNIEKLCYWLEVGDIFGMFKEITNLPEDVQMIIGMSNFRKSSKKNDAKWFFYIPATELVIRQLKKFDNKTVVPRFSVQYYVKTISDEMNYIEKIYKTYILSNKPKESNISESNDANKEE